MRPNRRGGALQPVDVNAKGASEAVALKEELLTKTTENKELADKAAALEAQLATMSAQLSNVSVTPPADAAPAASSSTASAAAAAAAAAAVPGVVRNPFAPPPPPDAKEGKKAKKDADHPKRPLTAYILYGNAVRDAVAAAHPDKKMTELAAVIGAQWKALGDGAKAPHEKAAAKDKARYEKEMDAYAKTKKAAADEEAAMAKYNEGVKAAAAMAFYEAHLAEEAAKAAAAADKGKKKAKKEEGAPKRPQSAYLLFAAEAREGVKAAHPDASVTEIMGLVAAEWKAAQAATTKKAKAAMARHVAAADADKARYEAEMEAWKEAKAAEAAAAKAAEADAYAAAKGPALAAYAKAAADEAAAKEWKAATKKAAVEAKAEKAADRAAKAEKKATAIKRPQSAYMYYCAAHREAVKAELGAAAPVTAVVSELARRWKGVSEADRSPHVAAAEADKARYEAAKADAAKAASC